MTWVGQSVSGEVTVAETPTDRAFWVERDGQRMLAVVLVEGDAEPPTVAPGETLRIRNGMLRDDSFLGDIPGEALDDISRNLAQEQTVFLAVETSGIEVL